ncbi:MAG: SCO family protein [Porphyrobacter sp.]|nr:SCO family protein [Porphyrobacter sp.]
MTPPRAAQPDGPAPRGLAIWLAAALMIGAGVPVGLVWLEQPSEPVTAPRALANGFALDAPDGRRISDTSLRGAPYVVMFGYTRCGDACTARLARLLAWREQLASDAARRLPVVFVSVDPDHDTPARMAAFAARAPAPILALTGSPAAVARAARAFNAVHFQAALCGGDYTINHSRVAYLVDAAGRSQAVIGEDASDALALARLRALLAA